MLSTHRRLIAVLGTTAAVVAGLATTSGIHGAGTSTPTASDYCLIVPPIWVRNEQVFPGGRYCVPVPDPSQSTS